MGTLQEWLDRQPLWLRIVVFWTGGGALIYAGIAGHVWYGIVAGVIVLLFPFIFGRRGETS